MAVRRVRIYNGTATETDVVGFSLSAADAPDNDRFAKFMEQRGYQWQFNKDNMPEGSVSARHVEIRPPLSKEHTKELGILCVGGVLDGKFDYGIVDPYHDGVIVYDNRHNMVSEPFGGGEVIARD